MEFPPTGKYYVLATIGWTLLYILILRIPLKIEKEMKRNTRLDLRNRMVSFIHGVVALILASYQMLTVEPNYGGKNTTLQNATMIMCLAYFTYDFFAMAYYGLLDQAITLHHGVVIFGMGLS
jgi:hypothetical protein